VIICIEWDLRGSPASDMEPCSMPEPASQHVDRIAASTTTVDVLTPWQSSAPNSPERQPYKGLCTGLGSGKVQRESQPSIVLPVARRGVVPFIDTSSLNEDAPGKVSQCLQGPAYYTLSPRSAVNGVAASCPDTPMSPSPLLALRPTTFCAMIPGAVSSSMASLSPPAGVASQPLPRSRSRYISSPSSLDATYTRDWSFPSTFEGALPSNLNVATGRALEASRNLDMPTPPSASPLSSASEHARERGPLSVASLREAAGRLSASVQSKESCNAFASDRSKEIPQQTSRPSVEAMRDFASRSLGVVQADLASPSSSALEKCRTPKGVERFQSHVAADRSLCGIVEPACNAVPKREADSTDELAATAIDKAANGPQLEDRSTAKCSGSLCDTEAASEVSPTLGSSSGSQQSITPTTSECSAEVPRSSPSFVKSRTSLPDLPARFHNLAFDSSSELPTSSVAIRAEDRSPALGDCAPFAENARAPTPQCVKRDLPCSLSDPTSSSDKAALGDCAPLAEHARAPTPKCVKRDLPTDSSYKDPVTQDVAADSEMGASSLERQRDMQLIARRLQKSEQDNETLRQQIRDLQRKNGCMTELQSRCSAVEEERVSLMVSVTKLERSMPPTPFEQPMLSFPKRQPESAVDTLTLRNIPEAIEMKATNSYSDVALSDAALWRSSPGAGVCSSADGAEVFRSSRDLLCQRGNGSAGSGAGGVHAGEVGHSSPDARSQRHPSVSRHGNASGTSPTRNERWHGVCSGGNTSGLEDRSGLLSSLDARCERVHLSLAGKRGSASPERSVGFQSSQDMRSCTPADRYAGNLQERSSPDIRSDQVHRFSSDAFVCDSQDRSCTRRWNSPEARREQGHRLCGDRCANGIASRDDGFSTSRHALENRRLTFEANEDPRLRSTSSQVRGAPIMQGYAPAFDAPHTPTLSRPSASAYPSERSSASAAAMAYPSERFARSTDRSTQDALGLPIAETRRSVSRMAADSPLTARTSTGVALPATSRYSLLRICQNLPTNLVGHRGARNGLYAPSTDCSLIQGSVGSPMEF